MSLTAVAVSFALGLVGGFILAEQISDRSPATTATAADDRGETALEPDGSEVTSGAGVSSTHAVGDSQDSVRGQLSGDPFVLVGAGDIADCSEGAEATADILDAVVRDHADAIVFTTGDNAYDDGAQEEFLDCYEPTWGRHKSRTRPAPGNHDYGTEDAAGYFAYFGSAAGSPDQGYYSFKVGEWQVVVLNSNCSEIGGCESGSLQEAWLRVVLRDSTAECTLAYWHEPLFSSGEHGGDDDMRDLFSVLYEHGADLVITGHDHNYERFAPQDPFGNHDPQWGIRQFVVGTGGKSLDDFDDQEPNSEVRSNDAYGVLKLTLYDNGYTWEFLAEAGSSFGDTGAGACHESP